MVRLLLERGAKMRYEDTQYLLVIACRSGLPELAQLVFDNSAHLGEKGREIGHVVVNAAVDANCSTEVIRLLLDNYAVPPDHFYLPSIVDKGHTAAARLLLERGVDANQEDNIGLTPLHGMLLQSRLSGDVNLEMVRLLVENGAEVNSRRGPIPLLVCALMLENDSLTSYLLKSGADIHWKDESELSLLHHAVITRCTLENLRYVIHKLVDLGVDREARDLNGLTALHRAISGSSLDKVSTLIQLPVDVNALTGSGAAPLHLAASSWRKPSLVQMLVKAGADINMRQQSDGYTPLHVATYCGNSQMLGQLLKCGADPSMRDHSGKTPLDIFEEFKEKRKLPNGLGSALRRKLSPPQPRAGKSPREPANKSVLLPRNTRTSARLRGKDAADDDKATERPAKRARVPKK
jgi:ankyrin repeat protein